MAPTKIIFLLLTALSIWPGSSVFAAVDTVIHRQAMEAAADLFLPFIENKGQVTDPGVAYVADTLACRVAVTRDGQIIYRFPRNKVFGPLPIVIRESLAGESVQVDVQGRIPQPTKVSYFQGRDPTRWQRKLQSYGAVALGHIGSDIQVELKAHGHNVEKLFYLRPGADPGKIRLVVQGAEALRVDASGELEIANAQGGIMRFTKPVAFQTIGGRRYNVPVRYRVQGDRYGFELGAYDTSQPLVIDPLIRVFPVTNGENSRDIAIMDTVADGQGNIYAAGYANDMLAIWKFDRRIENLLATAYFSEKGRYAADIIRAIALDSQGNVFVAGTTYNPRFPLIPGCPDTDPGEVVVREGFVAKFSADLETMLASTYIGGANTEDLYDLAINSNDQVYVAGYSKSGSSSGQLFPVTAGAFDIVPPPRYQKKAVVARLDNALTTFQAATFLGGNVDDNLDRNEDVAYNLAIDREGNVWVAGRTNQPDFPVTYGCLDDTPNGAGDVFLSKLNADLTRLLVSTYIGGSQDEAPTDLLLDSQGHLYLLGWTLSGNFLLPAGGYDTRYGNHEEDGFIIKLNSSAGQIISGTFLGGTRDSSNFGDDEPSAMALSSDESQLIVVGRTESASFPTTQGCMDDTVDLLEASLPERDHTGDTNRGDGFISVLSSDLTRLLYSTFVGGGGIEYFDAVLINGDDIIVGGETQSGSSFPMAPTTTSIRPRAVLMRFNDNETPVAPGGDTPGPTPVTSGGGGGGGGCYVASCIR